MESTKEKFFAILDSINRHRDHVEKKLKGFPYKIEVHIKNDEYIFYDPKTCRIFYRMGTDEKKLVECKVDTRIMAHNFIDKLEIKCEEKMNEFIESHNNKVKIL